eukprot:7612990-Ditylum_brightwellii.AAC.1
MLAIAMDDGLHKTWKRQQGSKASPNLDHYFEGYNRANIFQWELVVQMYAHGMQSLTDVNEVGQKLQTLLIKLQTVHSKPHFEQFNEKHERLKLKTFPNKANKVKKFLDYELLANNCNQNMSFILHAMGLFPFGMFKQKIMKWLCKNQVFLNMTIFRLSKETAVKIRYLTGVNQETVYCLGYQDNTNDLLDSSLKELNVEGQEEYFAMYKTNSDNTIYN